MVLACILIQTKTLKEIYRKWKKHYTNGNSLLILSYQAPSLQMRTQNVPQQVLTKTVSCLRGHKMYLNMWWPNPFHASEDVKPSQLVLTKPLPFQRGHQMYLNLCWSKPSHASEDSKCISTYVDQTYPKPARTQIATQHVLTKPLPFKKVIG